MKRLPILFLQIVVVLVGMGALFFLLWEPHLEGRNSTATPFQIYFQDPFLIYAYIASIPFFMVLFHTFTVLGYVRQNKINSSKTLRSLQTIQYSALSMVCFVILGEIFIFLFGGDEMPPAIFMGGLIILSALVTASASAMFEQIIQKKI